GVSGRDFDGAGAAVQTALRRSNHRAARRECFEEAAGTIFDESREDNRGDVFQPILRMGRREADAAPEIRALEETTEANDFEIERARRFAHFIGALATKRGCGEDYALGICS